MTHIIHITRLINPIAMDKGLRFAVREGNRTERKTLSMLELEDRKNSGGLRGNSRIP